MLAKSAEAVDAGQNLEQSMGKSEVDELMESADWAVTHACANCKNHLNFY